MKTVTYNPLTHKIVPIEPDENMCRALFINLAHADSEKYVLREVILAAPEYQESEQIPVAIGEVQHYAAPANLPAYVNVKWYRNLPKNGAKVYALPLAPDGDKP